MDIGIPKRVNTSSALCFTIGFTPKFNVVVFSLYLSPCVYGNAFVTTTQVQVLLISVSNKDILT